MQTRWLTLGLLGVWLAASPACSANDAEAPKSGGYGGSGAFGGSGGTSGTAGTAGTAGSAGTAGTAGTAGSAGTAGTAGTAGAAGSAGTGGNAGTDAGTGGSAGADAGDTTPPTVQSVSPADASQGAPASTTLGVTFSEAMDTSTLTASTAGTACSGTLQLSSDNFSTCVAMSSVQLGSGNSVATLTPVANLGSLTTYKFRVTVGAKDAAQNALAAQFTSANGFSTAYFHSILIDGTNDFSSSADKLASSTSGGGIYISIDAQKLYLGVSNPDILAAGAGSGNKFVYFLISEDSTLATGNTSSSDSKAKFGASAKMHYQWKERVDGASYSEFRTGNGSDWNTDWTTTGKSVNRSAGYVEGSIALSQLGNPTTLAITTYIVDYAGDSGNGWVYNMLAGATDGTGATPRDLVSYVVIDVPAKSTPNAAANLKSF